MNNITKNQDGFFQFNCPWCSLEIIVHPNDVRCSIFRHGVFKKNGEQLNPHACKEDCDKAVMNNEIYGCGKPFRFMKTYVEQCDYL